VRRFVVLAAMGVLYRHGNVVGGVLVPYLRDRGCSSSESEIASEDTSAHPVDGFDVPVARDMAELLTQGRRGWCED
jgi:hypothetical protein